jgi:hypothetical protein
MKMTRRQKIASIGVVLIVVAISIVAFATVQAETTKVAAVVGDLYAGDHIVIRLYGTPNILLDGRGSVYVDGKNLGSFNYALFEKDSGEIVIYVWK